MVPIPCANPHANTKTKQSGENMYIIAVYLLKRQLSRAIFGHVTVM